MTWRETEATLVAGPVPATDPGFPVELRLQFEGVALSEVEAQMASGERYRFGASAN